MDREINQKRALSPLIVPLLFVALMLNGCVSTKRIEQGQTVERDYFSIIWNTASWDFMHSEEKRYVAMEKGDWSDGDGDDSQEINIIIYNSSNYKGKNYWKRFADFSVDNSSHRGDEGFGRHRKAGSKELFDKKSDFGTLLNNPDVFFDGFLAYNKKWSKITYVQGIRCLSETFLRGQADQMKLYNITCGYYDKKKGKRELHISFGYRSKYLPANNYNNSESNWKKISKTGEIPHVQPVENQTKQAVKQIISTLKIKNLNRERMEREGLMHDDKKFEISEY